MQEKSGRAAAGDLGDRPGECVTVGGSRGAACSLRDRAGSGAVEGMQQGEERIGDGNPTWAR